MHCDALDVLGQATKKWKIAKKEEIEREKICANKKHRENPCTPREESIHDIQDADMCIYNMYGDIWIQYPFSLLSLTRNAYALWRLCQGDLYVIYAVSLNVCMNVYSGLRACSRTFALTFIHNSLFQLEIRINDSIA